MFTEALQTAVESIFMMVLTLVVPAATAWLGFKINAWFKAKGMAATSEYAANMFYHIGDTLEAVVDHTTKTFVDELKSDGVFDAHMAIEAMKKTKNRALCLLNDEAKSLIERTHGDIEMWIETEVESILTQYGLARVEI